MITVPSATENTLKVDTHPIDYSDFDLAPVRWLEGEAKWVETAVYNEKAVQVVTNRPVGGVLELGSSTMTDYSDVTFTRYTSYEISYTYQGKTVGPYSALFLYGSRPNGQAVIASQYLFLDHQALCTALIQPAEPTGLTRTHLRDIPEVRQYLTANQVSSERCVLGKGELCCVEDKCGLAGPDLAEVLAQPLVRKDPKQ